VWMLQEITSLDICRGKHIEEICIRKCVWHHRKAGEGMGRLE
jgi:hypothetical protein